MNRAALRETLIERAKRKLSESTTPDLLILQAIKTIEEIDRTQGMLAKRMREWYALEQPRIEHELRDHHAIAKKILEGSSRTPDAMGATITQEDHAAIVSLARRVYDLYVLRDELEEYISDVMDVHFPNLKAVAGALIGAKLISLAGDAKRMAMFPASTIQILGAEKSFFRFLRNRSAGRSPKYGVLFSHPMVLNARKENRGKVARAVADKISLAIRIDYFGGDFKGDEIVADLTKRFA